jgi:alkylation response protein AidB-like acyl-CoA dehydrogenase
MSEYLPRSVTCSSCSRSSPDWNRWRNCRVMKKRRPNWSMQFSKKPRRFAAEILSPLNWPGDQEGAHWHDKTVTMPAGFKEAYKLFADSGWTALACEPEWGGQGLPKLVAAAVAEMWKSANHSFSLCPLLTAGAIEALVLTGSDELKTTYLEKWSAGCGPER